MRKREQMAFFLFFCTIFLACKTQPEQEIKPNVIFILADDMGYGDLSIYGQTAFQTPRIDRMAEEGMQMTSFYTGSTVCAPSRAALLTGKHVGHCSVRGNFDGELLGDDEITLAKVMKQAGYTTGCIGKWGLGHPPPPDDPNKKGFDYFWGYVNMWHAHNFFPEFVYENGVKYPLKGNKTQLIDGQNPWADMPEGTGVAEKRAQYVPFLIDEKAGEFIEQNKDNPFFLYLAYNTPHANNEGVPDGMEVPDYGEFENKDWPSQEKGFAKMMVNLDNSVGKVLDKLTELGIAENTLVCFCSDNGPHGEGGHQMEFFNSNGDLNGMKRDLYEGGIHTPFIAWWPGQIKAGTQSNHMAAFWDVLPTLCDLTQVEKPADIDGISFLPSLKGNIQDKKHDYLYWEFYEGGGKQGVLWKNWKAVSLNVRQKPGPVGLELYNLDDDPAETNNIADKHPEVIKKMVEFMNESHAQYGNYALYTTEKGKSAPEEGKSIPKRIKK